MRNENNKLLRRILNRSWSVGAAYNNVRGQGHGAIYCLYPLLDKLYPNPEDKRKRSKQLKDTKYFTISLHR